MGQVSGRGPKSFDELRRKSKARRERLAEASVQGRTVRPPRNDLTPKLELVYRHLDELTLPKRSVRKAEQAHVAEIARSLSTFGQCRPIEIGSDNEVIDGAATLHAARQLGYTQIACVVIDHLTKAELRSLRITLNRLGEKGAWDFDALKLELEELILDDAPIDISGFSAPEIDQILLGEADSPAEVGVLEPVAGARPVSRRDDLFILGGHRLICADAREPSTLAPLMHGRQARLVLTDQPYNVPVRGHITKGRHREFAMASGEMSGDEYFDFNVAWMSAASAHLVNGGLLASFIDWRGLGTMLDAADALDLVQINLVVWAKSNGGQGSLYRSQHELLPIFKLGTEPHLNNVELGRHGRWRSNLWAYPGAASFGSDSRAGLQLHPTVKPTSMIEDAMLDLTARGEIVVDVFAGSGSAFLAAENTGRRAFGVEIDSLYCDVIIQRWQALTGLDAVLENTGETFAEVAARRHAGGAEPRQVMLLPAPILQLEGPAHG